jgi:hypothetical protein
MSALVIAVPAALAALGALAGRPEGALLWCLVCALCAPLALAPLTEGSFDRAPAPTGHAPSWRAPLCGLVLAAAAWSVIEFRHGGVPRVVPALALLGGVAFAASAVAGAAPRAAARSAPLVAAALAVASHLPDLFGHDPGAFARLDPRLGAFVLDLQPAALVAETAGLDWMRHGRVYEAAGTDWFSDLRRPHDGTLAALVALVVGCLALAVARRRAARVPEQR